MDSLRGGSYRRRLFPIGRPLQGVEEIAQRLERLNGD
jgi:hypothetical protein